MGQDRIFSPSELKENYLSSDYSNEH
jgi:hypothetical protein